jgi:large repetitive protein
VVATSVADARASVSAVVATEPPVTSTPVGNFTAVGNMTVPRAFPSAVLLQDGRVLVVGGEQSGPTAELYNPATKTFQASSANIVGIPVLLNNGEVLVLDAVEDTNSAELYDPKTDSATPTGNMLVAQWILTSSLLADGKVLVMGTHDAEVYDPESGIFAYAGPSGDPGFLWETVTLLTNGKLLFTGCTGYIYCASGVVAELFDPQTGTFSVTGPMVAKYFPDYAYTATLLADGRVLFLGSNDWPELADAEVYDPAAGTFASIAGPVSQEVAPASRLTDGTVLIAGGQVPGGDGSAGAELYVAASDTFEPAGEMTAGRQSHTATSLPDDTVLITGGYTFWSYPNSQPTSSAEVYKPR